MIIALLAAGPMTLAEMVAKLGGPPDSVVMHEIDDLAERGAIVGTHTSAAIYWRLK